MDDPGSLPAGRGGQNPRQRAEEHLRRPRHGRSRARAQGEEGGGHLGQGLLGGGSGGQSPPSERALLRPGEHGSGREARRAGARGFGSGGRRLRGRPLRRRRHLHAAARPGRGRAWWPWSRRAAPCAICAATPSAPAPTSTLSAGTPPGSFPSWGSWTRSWWIRRAPGLADGVVASIAAASPRRVAYVSCDASTWARDAARFEREGYRLIRVTPVDLFPQTYHVEVVSIFERSGS